MYKLKEKKIEDQDFFIHILSNLPEEYKVAVNYLEKFIGGFKSRQTTHHQKSARGIRYKIFQTQKVRQISSSRERKESICRFQKEI